MKQEERKARTIRKLLDATEQLIAEKDCASITMNEIMERSNLSKGAIFHHVKTKDEIFARVLMERLEETDRRFTAETELEEKTFEGPMRQIARGFSALDDGREATNKVLAYLLGKQEDPAVKEALGRYYEQSVRLSRQWIASGQRHGVIPETLDAGRAGEMFTLLSLGLRVRASLPNSPAAFTSDDFAGFIVEILQPNGKIEKRGESKP
ncbi:TetR/AcrR family transcriptional regulator [Paenibacillaceae bacterium WGS1546]|uniref:TetR/AcrR family transcriptional regulator n=1 Tax=Cohnella sp. WGS1546 TaxID=3366810 RepID=UPI00372D3891